MANASGARGRFEDYALLWGLIGVVALLSVLPLARLVLEGVMPGGALSGDAVAARAVEQRDLDGDGGTASSPLSAGRRLPSLLGGVVALAVSLTDIRGRNAFVFCYVMPLMLAPQVVALAWLQMFGPSSPLLKLLGVAPALGSRNPLYSPGGIILVLGVQYAPLVFLTLRAGLRTLPQELLEAALAGGAKPLRVIRTIVLPLMTPPLLAGVALSFVSCLGNFGIPALLGIPGNYLVLPTLIYQRLAGFGPAVLSEVAVLSVLIGMIADRRDRRAGRAPLAARFPHGQRRGRGARVRTAALASARRDRAVGALVPRAGAAVHGAAADLARSRRRRAARRGERDARELPLRAVRARGRAARVRQQLRPVRGGGGHRSC